MKKIQLRLADLRKQKKLTQQELADAMGVSFQTISKWETAASMPDITLLPPLAEYFRVSTDQLLGLKPLDGESYIPEQTGTKDFWNHRLDYLLRTRKRFWNDDYIRFLVSQVWNIHRPVSILDCGCGYGFLGLLLLPVMPRGSTYTGIDFAENLIREGQRLFAKQNITAEFICKNIDEYTVESQYDFVICQAVLRHLDNPDAFIRKMISFAKPEGYVVCMDVNREFESCGLYVDGMDYRELCLHEGLEKKWQTELALQGRDYSVAIKAAHILEKLGLADVDVRMNDKVEFTTPRHADYEEAKNDFLQANQWTSGIGQEEENALILQLLPHGLSRSEAEEYCLRNRKIAEYFSSNPAAEYTFTRGIMIAYGRKCGNNKAADFTVSRTV